MIIIDTNVLLAFLLTNGITRRIISENPDVFITPEYCFEELWEHRERWNKKNLSDNELQEIVNDVKAVFVMPITPDVYMERIPEADLLIEDRDDSPIVALALSVDNEGVWTYNTKHFKQEFFGERLRVLSTKDVIGLYPFKE